MSADRELKQAEENLSSLYRAKARGIMRGIGDYILTMLALVGMVLVVVNTLGFGTDPTDKSGWTRSGLYYYKDYGTGREYIATSRSGVLRDRHAPAPIELMDGNQYYPPQD